MTNPHLKRTAVLIAVLVITAGCAVNRATGGAMPGVDLSTLEHFYVVKHDRDGRGVNEIIVSKLLSRGYDVSTGPAGAVPDNTDAIVTYIDKWTWDITMYMLELSVSIDEPATGFSVAEGNSLHTSLTRKSPEEMVEEVIENIFSGVQSPPSE